MKEFLHHKPIDSTAEAVLLPRHCDRFGLSRYGNEENRHGLKD